MKNKIKVDFRLKPTFLNMLIIAIAVVFFWRGTWNLLDMYFFPEDPVLSNILSVLFGLFFLYLPDKDIKELI